MIDIFCVIHRNYTLHNMQVAHWRDYIKAGFRLHIIDNTPRHLAKKFSELDLDGVHSIQRFDPSNSFDGTSHGETLDFAVKKAESDFIGVVDSDFFWFNPDILDDACMHIDHLGYECVGASAFYKDWSNNIDAFYPERHSSLAPACWGMFVKTDLAQKFSFVCTPEEGSQMLYTGWRLRQHIIENDIKRLTFQGFYPYDNDDQTIAYGESGKPQGIHFLKGSAARAHIVETLLPKYIEEGKAKW